MHGVSTADDIRFVSSTPILSWTDLIPNELWLIDCSVKVAITIGETTLRFVNIHTLVTGRHHGSRKILTFVL